MSFFEDDDEPGKGRTRPRRTAAGPVVEPPDAHTLRVRRIVVAVIGVLILLLLLFVIRGCLDTRSDNALKDYNRELSAVVRESDTQVGEPFFGLLSQGGAESPQDLATSISGYRVTAQQQLDQALALDVPDDMVEAHRAALIALEMRRDGLDAIAQRIRPALGDEGDAADTAIAGIASQMGAFLASDVLWQTRVTPLIKSTLDSHQIGGQRVASTRNFLEGTEWLDEQTVADQLGQTLAAGGSGGSGDTPAPGLHGTGIQSVSAGDVTLEAGAVNRIPLSTDTLTVSFTNQGENDELDVDVVVELKPDSGSAIRIRRTVDTVAQGQTATASLQLDEKPAAGVPVTITASVRPVPGEEKTDNNELEFRALFTEG